MNGHTTHYVRVNVLIALAFVFVIVCLFIVVSRVDMPEAIRNVVMLVLGRFLGYVDQIYNFEFGTTRSSTKKDETITDLTKTVAVAAGTAQAVQQASDMAASGAVQPTSVGTVNMEAETVNVEKKP